ncbi:MAG: spermidine synthase-like protein [Balneolaceae bacterium]|nr:MAG: spermidine synthase-like protein [Balneolaceae bacterium]
MPGIRIAIGLLSASVIAWQLVLIQILSIAHWHHFAYMVLSVAMLGFGASGTLLALFRRKFLTGSGFLIPFLMLLTSLAMGSSVYLVENIVGGFDTWLLFIDNSEIVSLVLVYLLYTLPFLTGALAIGLILTRYAADIGRIYFYNMAGSGLGGLTGVLAMWLLFPEQLAALFALLPLVAAYFCSSARNRKRLAPVALLALLIAGAGIFNPPRINISQYKGLSGTMNLPGADVLSRESSPHGVIEAVKTDASRYAPGVSLNYTGVIPVEPMVFVNGNWSGPVKDPAGITDDILSHTTKQLPWLVRPAGNILITSTGTGRHAFHAIANNANHVTAVEPNPGLTGLTNRISHGFYGSSILDHTNVLVVHQSNRAWLNRSDGGYSHIILPTLDAFGGTSGLYALQEQYDLTLEAFAQMWDLLLDDGVISVTSWMDQPPRNTLRILATLAETAERNGIAEPERHIAAIRSWSTITFVLSRSPLTGESADRIREFCERNQFDPALLPGISMGERQQYNVTESSFFGYMDAIVKGDRTGFYNEYLFNVVPATDNRPFFSQFLKSGNIGDLITQYGRQTVPFIELGYLVLLLTGVQIFLAAVLFIVLPLFRLGWRGSKKSWTLIYFGGIGTGFMFVEINLIQQFIHYFGQPVYATATVLGILLISSGTGSYFSGHITRYRRGLEGLLLLLALLVGLLQVVLPLIIGISISMPAIVRIAASVLIIAPVGFLMGMPFPGGIRRLSGTDSAQVPWAWGINGCFSVISTVLAVWLALEWGYSTVLFTGALAYALAGAATLVISR